MYTKLWTEDASGRASEYLWVLDSNNEISFSVLESKNCAVSLEIAVTVT